MDDEMTLPVHVYFVSQKATFCTALLKAFSYTVQSSSGLLKPLWIHEDDLLSVADTVSRDSKNVLFVCETFSGPVFHTLRQLKLRICSPDYMLSEPETLVRRWLDTKVPTIPLLNTLMSGIIICCSGLTPSVKIKIYQQVLLMGGNFSTVLRLSVTHLIADRVGSAKYFAAVNNGIKIMTSEWTGELWEQSLLGHSSERDQIIELLTAEHVLPPLKGLKLYVDPSLAQKSGRLYNRIIQSCGGTSCGDVTESGITHVLTEKSSSKSVIPGNAIHVSPQWLIDSSKNKKCEESGKYVISRNKSPFKPGSSRVSDIRSKRASITPSSIRDCATSTPKKVDFRIQKDIPESISPVRELRRSPRKHKPFVTPEKSATAPRLGSGGFLFTVRSVSSLEGIASPVGSKGERGGNISSSVPADHDENACDGLMDESPRRVYPTAELPATISSNSSLTKPTSSSTDERMVSADSTCDVLLSSSQPDFVHSVSSQSTTVVPSSPIKTSKNLARRILNLGSITKSWGKHAHPTKSPSKLSCDDLLRPKKATFVGSYHRFSLDANSSSQMSWDHETNSERKETSSSTNVPDLRVVPKNRFFMVSRLKDDLDKEILTRLQSAVTSLGADFLSGARFNSACTHLVCVKPYHTEKFIAACCAGKRVLHVNYIFDSLEAGMFLEEDNYEWGNSFAGRFSQFLTDSELRWATTSAWWRCRVSSPELRAFHGWQVIFTPNSPRKESYESVIQAGGGVVLDEKSDGAEKATHLFHGFSADEDDQLQAFLNALAPQSQLKLLTGHQLEAYLQEEVHGELPSKHRRATESSTQLPRSSQTAEKSRKPAFSTLTSTTIKQPKRKN